MPCWKCGEPLPFARASDVPASAAAPANTPVNCLRVSIQESPVNKTNKTVSGLFLRK